MNAELTISYTDSMSNVGDFIDKIPKDIGDAWRFPDEKEIDKMISFMP